MSESTFQPNEADFISRGTTGKRILFTILFIFVVRVVEAVLAIIILFELAFSLITRRSPSDRVVRFADRIVRYTFQIGRYLTYNRTDPPFPFDDFPNGDESEQDDVDSPPTA